MDRSTEKVAEKLIEVVQQAIDEEVTEVTVKVKLIEDALGEILLLGNK
jgi:hypothetical protein